MKLPKKLNRYVAIAGLCFAAGCSNEPGSATTDKDSNIAATNVPVVISYTVVNEFPHDPAAFTEGLEYRDGVLYEGTGLYGASEVRKCDLKTGKVLTARQMDQRYFGEGITILNDKIYQLTYREGKGFIYDRNTLKPLGSFTINTAEGWGMTNNGTSLIFDDGSNILHFIDATTFKEVKNIAVTDEEGPVKEINELEMIHGFIYANQWRKDLILKIDTATGRVVGRADLSDLRAQAGIGQTPGRRNAPDVLNGIAYDAATNRIFITGKYWPKLFEVRLDN